MPNLVDKPRGSRVRRRKRHSAPLRSQSNPAGLTSRLVKNNPKVLATFPTSGSSTSAISDDEETLAPSISTIPSEKPLGSKKGSKQRPKGSIRLSKSWVILFDKGIKRYYFINLATRKRTWRVARAIEGTLFLLLNPSNGNVEQWLITFHKGFKRYYFHNMESKESHWLLPPHQSGKIASGKRTSAKSSSKKSNSPKSRAKSSKSAEPKKNGVCPEQWSKYIRTGLGEVEVEQSSVKESSSSVPLLTPTYVENQSGKSKKRNSFCDSLFTSGRQDSDDEEKAKEKSTFKKAILRRYSSSEILGKVMIETSKFKSDDVFSEDDLWST